MHNFQAKHESVTLFIDSEFVSYFIRLDGVNFLKLAFESIKMEFSGFLDCITFSTLCSRLWNYLSILSYHWSININIKWSRMLVEVNGEPLAVPMRVILLKCYFYLVPTMWAESWPLVENQLKYLQTYKYFHTPPRWLSVSLLQCNKNWFGLLDKFTFNFIQVRHVFALLHRLLTTCTLTSCTEHDCIFWETRFQAKRFDEVNAGMEKIATVEILCFCCRDILPGISTILTLKDFLARILSLPLEPRLERNSQRLIWGFSIMLSFTLRTIHQHYSSNQLEPILRGILANELALKNPIKRVCKWIIARNGG